MTTRITASDYQATLAASQGADKAYALPSPISTNALFANLNTIGRQKTRKYRKWCKLAEQYLAAQGPLQAFSGPVSITIYAGQVGVGCMDADNTLKAPLDALKAAGVIKDDNWQHVRSCEAIWLKNLEGMIAVIAPASDTSPVAQLSKAGRDLVRFGGA